MDEPIPIAPPKIDPESLTLRVSPRPVMRLSRRMLAVLSGVLAFAVLGATVWSLQSGHRKRALSPVELYNVDRVTRSEALQRLPSDYSQVPPPALPPEVPVLGAPLPGDLGGPMLKQQGLEQHRDSAEADRLARLKEAEEAANSSVFFRNGGAQRQGHGLQALVGSQSDAADNSQPFDTLATGSNAVAPDPTAVQNRQEQKLAFMTQGESGPERNPGNLQLPGSPYQVMAGTQIPAALVTGLDSDLPGQVIATVTEAVYDTATGRHLLIPQGSRLIGRYDSQVAFGQRRVLLIWTRLILPDTSSIALDKLPGIDTAGYAGLEDGVDWHWDRILAGAALSTLLGIGAELAIPQDLSGDGDSAVIAGRESVQDTTNEIGQEITRRNLNIQPTLTVRPGYPMRVMVNKDLILRPYQPLFFQRGASQ